MAFMLAHSRVMRQVLALHGGVVLVEGYRQRALPGQQPLASQFSLSSVCLGDRLLSDSQVPTSTSPLSRHQIFLDNTCVRADL